MLHNLK